MGSAESSPEERHKKENLISVDLNAKQLWERLHGLSENLGEDVGRLHAGSSYPFRHGNHRRQDPGQSAYFLAPKSVRELVTRCMDVMESQQQALSAKEAAVAELQREVGQLRSQMKLLRGRRLLRRASAPKQQQQQQAQSLAGRPPGAGRRRGRNAELQGLQSPSIHGVPGLAACPEPARKRTRLATFGVADAGSSVSAAEAACGVSSPVASSRSGRQQIETPSWRTIDSASLKVSYKLEGTEDLSNGHYESLHQRLESDERRRKLWDMRAQRERAYYDKLRQKAAQRAAAAAGCQSGCEPEDIKELEPDTRIRLVGKSMHKIAERMQHASAQAAAKPTAGRRGAR